MTALIELIDEASRQGINIAVEGGAMECSSSKPIPPEIVFKLKENKAAILQLLTRKNTGKAISSGRSARSPAGQNTKELHHKWLKEHAEDLRAAGYTDRDLFNDRWPIGLAFLKVWNRPGLTVKLHGEVLCFSWLETNGQPVTQTARPEPKRA